MNATTLVTSSSHGRIESGESPQGGEPRLTRGEIVLLALTVLIARLIASRAFPIYDDAFITYRYARNLAEGLGMVYNPGAAWEPILGTTTPGYTVLLAGLNLLGLPIIGSSLAINFICDALSSVILIQLFDRRWVSSLIAVLAFASIPEIARISAGGMEPPLVVFCALYSLKLSLDGRMLAAGSASAVACTLRPECVLLVATLAVLVWIRRGNLLRFFAPIVVIGALAAGILTWYYGSPISQSIKAKSQTHSGVQNPGFSRVPDILEQAFWPSHAMLALLLIVAVGIVAMIRGRSKFIAFAVFAMSIVAAYLIAQPKTWGWYFYAPMLAWVGWLGLGCEQIARWIGYSRLHLQRSKALSVCVLAGAVLCIVAVSIFPRLRADQVTPRIYGHFEQWAKDARIAERQATILASDIGMIGWYANTRILDSAGLVWPDALALPRQVDQIRKHLPDYAILVVRRSRLEPFRIGDPELAAKYRPIRRLNESNATGLEQLEPDIAGLRDRWEQDYIIYERIAQ